jgi:hypothetical protein
MNTTALASQERAWVMIFIIFAGLALTRLRDGTDVVSPLLAASGFALLAIGQYLKIRQVAMHGKLYFNWRKFCVGMGWFLIPASFAVRYWLNV